MASNAEFCKKNHKRMEEKMISVILPAYNAEKFLREAIDSILGQTYKNFELIVLNDGSTDRTEDIILSYDDPRIRYVKNEKNLKLIKTLNKGIDLAKGEYIARMDADDISLPTRFEIEVKYLQEHPEIDVVSCFPYNMSMDGVILGKSSYFSVTRPLPCKFVSMYEASICHPICMFKAEAIKKYKYSDKEEFLHIEAYELWNRMFHSGAQGSMIPEYMLYYRDNATSVCHVHNDEQWTKHLSLLKRSLYKNLGLIIEDEVALCIMKKKETNDIDNIGKAFDTLDNCLCKFKQCEDDLEREDINEIRNWIQQRKLAILLTSILSTKGVFRYKLILKMLFHSILLMNPHNLTYIKNRVVRMRNEKKLY